MATLYLQRYKPLKHLFNENCWRYLYFPDSDNLFIAVDKQKMRKETANENKEFTKSKTRISNLDKVFKGTLVNQALASLHAGSLEI